MSEAAPPRDADVVSRDDADAWETALESLLGEGLPKLPKFDLPEVTRVTDPGAPAPAPLPSRTPVDPPVVSDESPPVVDAVMPTVHQPQSAPAAPETDPVLDLSPEIHAPPPLPVHAIDPATGEADEAAYKEWLVEWLAYAERYGSDAPADPTRVDR